MNLPAPTLELFSPRPTPIQPKAGDQCHRDGCSRSWNKSCTFSLCRACCDNRPAREKTCLTHHLGSKGSRAHPPPTTAVRPPATSILPPSQPHRTTPQPWPHPADSPDVQPTPTPTPIPTPTPLHLADIHRDPPSLLEHSRNAQPGLLPRSDPALSGVETRRRRAELLRALKNSRHVYIWLLVCLHIENGHLTHKIDDY